MAIDAIRIRSPGPLENFQVPIGTLLCIDTHAAFYVCKAEQQSLHQQCPCYLQEAEAARQSQEDLMHSQWDDQERQLQLHLAERQQQLLLQHREQLLALQQRLEKKQAPMLPSETLQQLRKMVSTRLA